MKNFLIIIFLLLSTIHIKPANASASTPMARTSAKLDIQSTIVVDNRAQMLKSYLQNYDSPLVPYAQDFVDHADKNKLDWKFVAAIAGVESGFGKQLPQNSYNGWGWGIYGNNVHYFPSWKEAIATISQELREKYMNKWGAKDVYGIGEFYAADPNWANKVTHFMNQIDSYTPKVEATLSISI